MLKEQYATADPLRLTAYASPQSAFPLIISD
jgi:hypothetical protein